MIKSLPKLITPSNSLLLSAGASSFADAFKIILVGVNNDDYTCDIKVSANSFVLPSPQVKEPVFSVGLGLKWNIQYGDKIWLETYYDRNREPIAVFVKTGTRWPATSVNNRITSLIYPSEIEMFTKSEMAAKLDDITTTMDSVETMAAAAQAELSYQVNNGILTSLEYADLSQATTNGYVGVYETMSDYRSEFSNFFSSAPSVGWRKLFRTYTLLGYTTKDFSSVIDGQDVKFKVRGTGGAIAVPTSTALPHFRIVQCVKQNQLIVDHWYDGLYPAKMLIDYHRPVHTFLVEGFAEDFADTQF